jgi:hypothetical protein
MALSTDLNRKVFTASAAQTAFAFGDVLYFNQTHLKVYVEGVLKTLSTDYTVSPTTNVPNGTPGGTVTFITPMVGGEQVIILREVPLTQDVDYQENEKFPANTHEQALDKLTMITQQLKEKFARQLTLSVTETGTTANSELPLAASRANKFFAFDGSGNILMSLGVGTAVPVSAFAATVIDDADAAAFLTTLGIPLTAFPSFTMVDNLTNNSTGFLEVPSGTTAQRPGGPRNRMIRYNTDLSRFEGYVAGAWGRLGGGATGAGVDAVFMENDQAVTGDYTITSGKNAVSGGPITINNGITVTIPSGSVWTVV